MRELLNYLESDRERVEDEEHRLVRSKLLGGLKPAKVLSVLIDNEYFAEAIFLIDGEYYSALFGLNSTNYGPDWIERTKRVLH